MYENEFNEGTFIWPSIPSNKYAELVAPNRSVVFETPPTTVPLFPSSFGHKYRSIIGRNTAFVGDNGVIGFYADNNAAGGTYDNTFTMWRGAGNSGAAPYSASIPPLNTWVNVVYTQASSGDWSWYENGQLTNTGNFTDAQNDFNFFTPAPTFTT